MSDENNLRVLHVYRTYFPDPQGGMQEAIRQICLATQTYGVSNTIYTLSPDPEPAVLARPEARVVRSLSWAAPASCDLGTPASLKRYRELAEEADVVHFLFPWPYGDLMHALMRPRTPSVVTYVSDVVRQRWLGKLYEPLMWRSLRNAKAVVANCPGYITSSPVLSTPEINAKVSMIPLGIVEDSYAKTADEGIFGKLGLEPDEPFFLFVGVLRYYKGVQTLVHAAKSVNAKIIVAGTGPEGAALRDLSASLSADNVQFAGQISDEEKIALLKACRALVLPSHLRSEAFGMVLAEAALFGRPSISCEIGTGTSFVNMHNESGLVVAPENVKELADAMNELLGDDERARTLGLGARARYERLFSGPALGQAYAKLFREVAKA
ncbi:rhamnosyl/mannosyltransferase [Paraburkholderia eburnea]|uniref:Rhamnosyl/mannosyltransferase n=1 Tax=Paraburkholderia eburnea TaxID=1189126 RepID=A0A2S4MME2_9BURK|nr:rhamnosyl/mannosyltransferase [Paraburkholderia eburnea]PRZ27040.1 rhamnosyl/mannosyltransferase [Paraburkholderia eburnea]